ncbi:E3 ubiquitin protein ligase DRIP2-like [Panicum miliaceum]|uniref:E3 ubiquitin protein ligase DRIP2-like n=1 Tax=Panicum miliaceum TaxID=4540 RepID=A0A3L6TGC1_PANMI|nr:E3 ubiquitin protein ligase DRIP2-like [Panicum miliaceum]
MVSQRRPRVGALLPLCRVAFASLGFDVGFFSFSPGDRAGVRCEFFDPSPKGAGFLLASVCSVDAEPLVGCRGSDPGWLRAAAYDWTGYLRGSFAPAIASSCARSGSVLATAMPLISLEYARFLLFRDGNAAKPRRPGVSQCVLNNLRHKSGNAAALPDHNLQDIRNKLFPIKKRKIDSPKVPATLPPKRKQRSLSSLGVVDTPSVAMRTGLTGKRTKGTRRAASFRATSPGNNGTMKSSTKSEDRDQKIEKSSAPQSTKVATPAKKTESRDQKKTEKTSPQQPTKAATAVNKRQKNTYVEVSSKPSSKRKNGMTSEKEELQKPSNHLVYAASKTKAPRSTPKIHPVTKEKIKKKEGEFPIGNKETENEVVIPGTRVGEHSNEPTLEEENNGSSSEPAIATVKAETEDVSNQGLSGPASILRDPITTPVWFSLVSSPNHSKCLFVFRKGGTQLPELSKIYLRIKDGSFQVSSVQRYIATKLDISDENEVEVTFHGEPICPSSTMRGLVELWLRRVPEKPVQAPLGAPATGFIMALGYRRRHRSNLVPSVVAVAVPPGEPREGDGTAVEPA